VASALASPLETTPKGLLQGPAAGAGAFTRPQGSPAQGRAEAGGLLLPDQLTRAALQLGPSRLRSPAAGRRTSQGAQAQIGHALCAGPFLRHLPVLAHATGACDGGYVSEASALGPAARTVDVEPPKQQQQQQRRRLWWRRIDHRICLPKEPGYAGCRATQAVARAHGVAASRAVATACSAHPTSSAMSFNVGSPPPPAHTFASFPATPTPSVTSAAASPASPRPTSVLRPSRRSTACSPAPPRAVPSPLLHSRRRCHQHVRESVTTCG
jgi:hypothetical protein